MGYGKVVTTCLLIKMVIPENKEALDLKIRREKNRRKGSKREKGRKIGKGNKECIFLLVN